MTSNILEQFFDAEEEARKEADAKVTPEQASLKPGDFCVRHIKGHLSTIAIYSEILDAAAYILKGRKVEDLDENERAEYEEVQDSYKEESMQSYRFTKSYSGICPEGELGDIHISTVTKKISKEEFIQAKINNWII